MSKLDMLLAAVSARAQQLNTEAIAASVVNEKIAASCAPAQEAVKEVRKGRKPLREALEIGASAADYEARRTAAAAAPSGSVEKRTFALDRRIADAKAASAYAESLRPAPAVPAAPEPAAPATEPAAPVKAKK